MAYTLSTSVILLHFQITEAEVTDPNPLLNLKRIKGDPHVKF